MTKHKEALLIFGIVFLMTSLIVIALYSKLISPTMESNFFNGGKLFCFEMKGEGLFAEVKRDCYKLMPIK